MTLWKGCANLLLSPHQVFVGEFGPSRRLHGNINNAVVASTHFILASACAFAVATLVQVVRYPARCRPLALCICGLEEQLCIVLMLCRCLFRQQKRE